MIKKPLAAVGILAALLLVPAGPALAEYDDEGFFVFLDAAFATAGNTDMITATAIDALGSTQNTVQFQPDWGSSPAGRIGFGYEWAGGSKVSVSYWQFDDDEAIAVDGPTGGFLNFAIGPAVYYDGLPYFAFGVPGQSDFVAEIKASTLDVTFGRETELGDFFTGEWHIGVRFASYEDTLTGTYDICASGGCDYGFYSPGDVTFDARKNVQGDMLGFRAGFRGTFFLTENLAVSSDLSYSMLEGDLEGESGLVPTGLVNGAVDPPTRAYVEDDHRSGNILEFEVGLRYYVMDDRLCFTVGYEHATWNGIPEDLVRNTPGMLAVLDERDTVGFSGYKVGVRFLF